MILHLGGDVIIPLKNVIAILDCENPGATREMARFLSRAREMPGTEYIPGDAKSCVVTCTAGREKIFFSPTSPATLLRRSRRAQEREDPF